MLTLRRGQREVFEPLVEEALEQRIFAFLRAYPAPELLATDDERLREVARSGIAEARKFGLTSPAALGTFAGLLITVGPRFFEYPAAREVLTDETIPPNERMRELAARLSDEDWEEAGRHHAAR
jgi:hypothetical protein